MLTARDSRLRKGPFALFHHVQRVVDRRRRERRARKLRRGVGRFLRWAGELSLLLAVQAIASALRARSRSLAVAGHSHDTPKDL
jgi:hypothetical protein